MRSTLIIVFILKLGLVLGQPVNLFAYPSVIKEGSTMSSFVPDGWIIVDSATGDLNGDNKIDFALIIKSKDSLITFTHIEQQGEQLVEVNRSDKYPRRILVVAFKDSKKDNFNLIEQNNSIILGSNAKIDIDNTHLKIQYNSYDEREVLRGITKYYFDYTNEQFLLTSVDGYRTDGLWTNHYFFDFVTQKWGTAAGKINIEKLPVTEWKALDNIQPKTIREFQPLSLYINGFYL